MRRKHTCCCSLNYLTLPPCNNELYSVYGYFLIRKYILKISRFCLNKEFVPQIRFLSDVKFYFSSSGIGTQIWAHKNKLITSLFFTFQRYKMAIRSKLRLSARRNGLCCQSLCIFSFCIDLGFVIGGAYLTDKYANNYNW